MGADLDAIKAKRKALIDSVNQPLNSQADLALTGQGKFPDTGRQSSGAGEWADSYLGAPVRAGLDDAAKKGFALSNLQAGFKALGNDPRTAPTGYDIANHMGIENPYLGAGVATMADLAQLPIGEAAAAGKALPGVAGVIEKLDSPLLHGSFNKYAPADAKISQGGMAGPGYYMTQEPHIARGFGDNILSAQPDKVKILDLHNNPDDLALAAKQLGVEAKDSKYSGGPYQALKDAFIRKNDPQGVLIGHQKDSALHEALQGLGYNGIRYNYNGDPAFNMFNPQAIGLKEAIPYNVSAKDGELSLKSPVAKAGADMRSLDTVEMMDPEMMKHLEGAGIDNPAYLEHISADKGYGSKALAALEASAKKRGADGMYLNASPLGGTRGLSQQEAAAKVRDFYAKNGYQVAEDQITNTMMYKKLMGQAGALGSPQQIQQAAAISALQNRKPDGR